jgi:hypothetical protein
MKKAEIAETTNKERYLTKQTHEKLSICLFARSLLVYANHSSDCYALYDCRYICGAYRHISLDHSPATIGRESTFHTGLPTFFLTSKMKEQFG